MHLEQRHVPPQLRPWVVSMWAFEGEFSHTLERVLPNGLSQLIVNLHEDQTRTYDGPDPSVPNTGSGIVVQGPHARPFTIDTAEQRNVIGVVFRAGGLGGLIGAPASEVLDHHVDLAALWGDDAATVRERLLGAPRSDRLGVLETLLAERLVPECLPDPAVLGGVKALEAGVRVADVVAKVGWSHKRFTRRFREAVGLGPKRFAAVRRFRCAIGRAGEERAHSWAEIAAACGYADQSHLIADFHRFAGTTPTSYAPRDATAPTHVALRDHES